MVIAVETLSHKRGEFIDAYASVETNLAYLLSALGQMDWATGYSIFFRMINSRSRSALLNDFMDRVWPKEDFPIIRANWSVIEKEFNSITNDRNAIIHWMVVNRGTSGECLTNPVKLHSGDHSNIYGEDIDRLKIRLWTLDHIIHNLTWSLQYERWRPLLQIFHERPIGRSLEEFRLLLNAKMREAPPPPSSQ